MFSSERGTPFTKRGFQAMLERAGKVTGFDMKIHPHMLRHACGFKLANDGVDTRTIQAYLGHKSIQHTVRYTELAPLGSKAYSGTELLRNLAQKEAPFFLMIKGDPTPMVPIEGGARKRCVKYPSTSLPPSSARPKNTPLKITRLECARDGGQFAGWELTGAAGLSEDESHGQAPHP